ncbi:MAG TPA: hypothetical protein VGM87_02440 [Roseomonas sp.]
MADLRDLQRAGQSVTGRAWITNPLRRAMLLAARPYFQRLLEVIDAQRRVLDEQRELLAEQRQALDALQADADRARARPQPAWAETAALQQLARAFDGLHKDQMALNHRLASMEDRQGDPAAVPR